MKNDVTKRLDDLEIQVAALLVFAQHTLSSLAGLKQALLEQQDHPQISPQDLMQAMDAAEAQFDAQLPSLFECIVGNARAEQAARLAAISKEKCS